MPQGSSAVRPTNGLYLFLPIHRNTNNSLTISLMKRQVVVTHTIRQKVIPPLLDSWVTKTPFVKMLCPQKKKFVSPYIPVKT